MCWGIPEVPVEAEMPKHEVGADFLDALAKLCKDYNIAHINVNDDEVGFTETGSLRTVSFMIYRDGKFGGVQYTEYEPEHKVDFGGATDVD